MTRTVSSGEEPQTRISQRLTQQVSRKFLRLVTFTGGVNTHIIELSIWAPLALIL
jgi:hypothetical protein